MKSSHKVIAANTPGAFSPRALAAWQPEDLAGPEDPVAANDAVDLATLLEIFRMPQREASDAGRGGLSARAVPWTPGDLADGFVFEEIPATFVDAALETVETVQPPVQDQAAEAGQIAESILEQARAQASELLLQAQRQADELLAEARQQTEAVQQAAYQKGLEDAQAETSTQLQAARTIHAEVNAWKEELARQLNPLMTAMVKEIAQKMFGEGIALSDQALQQNLNRVLANVKSLGDINIYLNPRDAATIDSAWRGMRSQISGSRVQIIPSETILPGGCFVEGQMGSVDARVETQLKVVLDTLSSANADEGAQP